MNITTPEQDLPLGNSDFALLRQNNKVYVDKTAMVHQLAKGVGNKVFIARPRRFGKSLLVSTFESLFKYGLRDFQGLAIEQQWTDKTYDVVRLDFSEVKNFSTVEEFKEGLLELLVSAFSSVGFRYERDSFLSVMRQLSGWLREQVPVSSVVLLIDEYDAPLTACLDQPELFEKVRRTLASFYAILKSNDGALRFLFITGITKYSKVSIFSEMNNLNDITLKPAYGTLLGYTEEEISRYFGDYLAQAAAKLGMTAAEMLAAMRRSYDGYCFDEQASTHVYAPWSTLNFLDSPEDGLKNYWIESGGQSSLLTNYVRSHSLKDPGQYGQLQKVDKDLLSISADARAINDVVLLMQAGYLTIKAVRGDLVYLGYPNGEVAQTMAKFYAALMLEKQALDMISEGVIRSHLEICDVPAFVTDVNKAFLAIDYKEYPVTSEANCRAMVSMFLNGAGLTAQSETHNALGRSDLEFTTGETHWVLEFKYAAGRDNPRELLQKALSQMEGRMYGRQSGASRLMRVGLVFSEAQRQIVAFKALEPMAI